MACGYELHRKGFEVVVVEKEKRAGGRVRTVRGWTSQERAEGGPEFIDPHHRYLLRYARHFGLTVEAVHLWDQLYEQLPPPADRDWDRFWVSLEELSEGILSARRPWQMTAQLRTLDRLHLDQWCHRLELAPAARERVHNWCWGVEAAPPDGLSVAAVVAEQRQTPRSSGRATKTLAAGLERLTQALAKPLDIRLDRDVVALEQDDQTVTVVTQKGERFRGQRAVVTVPAPLALAFRWQPALGSELKRSLQAVRYGSVCKTLVEFSSPPWEAPIGLIPSGEINCLWSTGSVMVVWVTGPWARLWHSWPERSRVLRAVEAVERHFPGARSRFLKGRSFSWPLAYSHWGLGFLSTHGGRLHSPHRRVHWAGEHTSPFAGYMEGALQSGVRAALQVVRSA